MRTLTIVVLLTLAGCGSSSEEVPVEETVELSRRQKDSLIADMPLPGAGAVGGALEALEATQRRAQAHDTIS